MRPVSSQSSAGVSVGQSISWPPIALISSRMICTTRCCTRQPSGMYVQRPAPDLADEPAADEELVRRGLRVCGRVAKGRREELRLPCDHKAERLVEPATWSPVEQPRVPKEHLVADSHKPIRLETAPRSELVAVSH